MSYDVSNSEQLSISYNGCENKVQIFFLSLYMCILSILYTAYVDLHQKGHEETEVLYGNIRPIQCKKYKQT